MVRRRRLSLFGHVARMPDNVLAKTVLRHACDIRDGVNSTLPKLAQIDRGIVLPSPDCTRFVQTAACQPETPSTVPAGSGRVENVRYGLLGLALTTTTTAVYSVCCHLRSGVCKYVGLHENQSLQRL